jgi:hypothetical protein
MYGYCHMTENSITTYIKNLKHKVQNYGFMKPKLRKQCKRKTAVEV